MRIPLRFQIMLPLATVAVVSLLTVGTINARLATRQTQATIDRQLQGVVDVLANSNFPLTDAVLRQMKGLSGAEFMLTDEGGRRVSTSSSTLANDLPLTHTVDTSKEIILGPQILIGRDAYFHSAIRLQRPLGTTESGVLHILFPRDQYDAAWRSAFLPPLVVGLMTVLAVALVTQWIANRISQNLAALGGGVQRLAGGEFSPVELPTRDDEVRDLTVAVNQTAVRLSEYEQHVRQTEQIRTVAMLGAGLAHEMRNAATGCRLAVDLHAESCPGGNEDDTLKVAKSQLQLMESRLQRFLQLGHDSSSAAMRPIDLVELVDELLPLVLPAAKHAGVRFEWRKSERPARILADADSLGMVIVNLLLNAIEAAQKQTAASSDAHEVSVRMTDDCHGQVELEISDSGAGPAPSIAENLFKPFVTTKAEGVGLGLAVAQQVARAHGGGISWNRSIGRTHFRLRLPEVVEVLSEERNGKHVKDSGGR